ncbi:MAG: 16S rRNA (guanine(966)-N(2))-methyltransferase RsmD [Candidatus Rokuibacteriota bacterium]|nr:MAG: 16S rRNA (guanine(966)-N(2))-methyltransferase RsmD [Candidatus Rokubacteria bacterium]
MHVIAGALKGRRLVLPRGHRTRPTADQVRIALMDTLMPMLPGARVLDLFAGAGGVGLEALSRGAGTTTFIERDPQAATALQQNINALGVRARARLVRADVACGLERLASANEHFEIVFLDPPYESDLVNATLARLGAGTITLAGSMVIAQHFTKQEVRDAVGVLERSRTRRFGETTLSYYQHRGERSAAPPRDPPPDRSEKDCEPSDSSPRA